MPKLFVFSWDDSSQLGKRAKSLTGGLILRYKLGVLATCIGSFVGMFLIFALEGCVIREGSRPPLMHRLPTKGYPLTLSQFLSDTLEIYIHASNGEFDGAGRYIKAFAKGDSAYVSEYAVLNKISGLYKPDLDTVLAEFRKKWTIELVAKRKLDKNSAYTNYQSVVKKISDFETNKGTNAVDTYLFCWGPNRAYKTLISDPSHEVRIFEKANGGFFGR